MLYGLSSALSLTRSLLVSRRCLRYNIGRGPRMSNVALVFLRPYSVLDFAVSVLAGLNSVYASEFYSSLVLGNPYIANGRKAVTKIARPLLRLCIMHPEAVQSTTESHYFSAPPCCEVERPSRVDRRGGAAGTRQAVARGTFSITRRGRRARRRRAGSVRPQAEGGSLLRR